MNGDHLGESLGFVWPIHPPRHPPYVDGVNGRPEQLLWVSNIAEDELTLELVESLVHLLQTLKGALCVIRCWGAWPRIGIWQPGNENVLQVHQQMKFAQSQSEQLKYFHIA